MDLKLPRLPAQRWQQLCRINIEITAFIPLRGGHISGWRWKKKKTWLQKSSKWRSLLLLLAWVNMVSLNNSQNVSGGPPKTRTVKAVKGMAAFISNAKIIRPPFYHILSHHCCLSYIISDLPLCWPNSNVNWYSKILSTFMTSDYIILYPAHKLHHNSFFWCCYPLVN